MQSTDSRKGQTSVLAPVRSQSARRGRWACQHGPGMKRSRELCAKDRVTLSADLVGSTWPEESEVMVVQKISIALGPFGWSLEGMLAR